MELDKWLGSIVEIDIYIYLKDVINKETEESYSGNINLFN